MIIPERDEVSPADYVTPGLTEKRKAMRVAVLIRSAKLVGRHGEFLCIIRDVSENGVKLRLFHPIPLDDGLDLELSTGERFAVECIWQDEGLAGFRFSDPIDLHRFIAETSPFPKRPVRLRLNCSALIRADGKICDAEIRDLSREGMSIETNILLALEQSLTIEANRLSPRTATVRWRRRPTYGLVLERLLTFEDLARTAARMQLSAEFLATSAYENSANRL